MSAPLAKKLNLKDGMKIRVVGRPAGVDLGDLPLTTSAKADAVLAFVKTRAEVDAVAAPAIEAARADRLAWVAYPKAGQLATDVNRDVLAKELAQRGVESVRLVALDSVWSAMRFRPGGRP